MNNITIEATMTSLELVDLINRVRAEEGKAVLAHSDFLKKVKEVLGEDGGKFSSIYLDSMNRQKPCYNLPKREAHLMVMSESYKVQAAVYDRMAALENGAPPSKPIPADRPTKVFPEYFRIAKLIGLDKNAAALSANQATLKVTGTNVLSLLGQTHLESESQERWYTPTQLGARVSMSAIAFNKALFNAGLQDKVDGDWLPTDEGKAHSRLFDTGKAHSNGTAVTQLKWADTVLEALNG